MHQKNSFKVVMKIIHHFLKSESSTTKLMGQVTGYLERELAPETSLHGVLVDVYGVGVLITGDSGVGKSETALELVKRGHRLVADDNVEIKEINKNELIGKAPKIIEHLLEIRGLGIINVMTLFGAGSILMEKNQVKHQFRNMEQKKNI